MVYVKLQVRHSVIDLRRAVLFFEFAVSGLCVVGEREARAMQIYLR